MHLVGEISSCYFFLRLESLCTTIPTNFHPKQLLPVFASPAPNFGSFAIVEG